jgi:glucose-1-phosphate thymidylyltransferase
MLAGIRDVLVITTPHEQDGFRRLLGDGGDLGLRIEYAVQPSPEGIAQAFLIGRDFIGRSRVALALGDNIFFGHGFPDALRHAAARTSGATIFAYWVRDPERYGVVDFDREGRAVGLEEKPARARSSYAVTGLYFYDHRVVEIAADLKPSARGELEITDVNVTGTHESLLQASNFIQVIEERQGLMVACLEEIAFTMGYMTAADVRRIAEPMRRNAYGQYLLRLLGPDTA